MKKAAYIPIMIFLLLTTLVAAAAPTLLDTFNLNATYGYRTHITEIDSNHIAILDHALASDTCRIRIVDTDTGEITDSTTVTCTYPIDIDYDGGTLAVCYSYHPPSQSFRHYVQIYKIPDYGFMNPAGGTLQGSPSIFFGGCELESSSSTTADVFVGSYGVSQITGSLKIYFNGSTAVMTPLPIVVPKSHNRLFDESNEVVGTGTNFYDFSDPYNNSGKILDTLLFGDSLRAWNFDSSNPEWVAANGYIALADDYSAIVESSGRVIMDEVIAYGGRDEILGVINDTWYNGDFSITPGTPTLTNTGVKLANVNTGTSNGVDWLTTASKIYYLNTTNQILTVWEYQIAPTCDAANGCYMDEPFIYTDSVLNHGWAGWSVNPIDGELKCFGSTQYNTYQFTPITQSVGTFYVEYDARICGEESAPLEMTLFNNNDALVQVRITGNSANGTIQDHTGAILSNTIGNTVADPGNITCSGLKRFENNYLFALYPQNNPRTYDVYINAALVSQNNLWTTVGQQVLSVNSIGFSGGITIPYCFWGLDNVKIYTQQINEPDLTDEEILEERNTIGGEVFSLDQQFHFDRDQHCETTENSQLCFLRWIIGGLLDWLWRLIINNPLSSLAFILVAIVLVVAGHNSGKK